MCNFRFLRAVILGPVDRNLLDLDARRGASSCIDGYHCRVHMICQIMAIAKHKLEFPRYVRHLKLEEWSFRQGVPNGHKEVSRGVPS